MGKKTEMAHLLEERAERIGLLEQRIEMLERLLDGYKTREQSIIDALKQAGEAAKARVIRADVEAEQIVAGAQEQAKQQLADAREEGARILEESRKTARAYESILAAYNSKLERNAADLEASAAQYAAFIKERKINLEMMPDEAAREEVETSVFAQEPVEEQDDPKTLLHSIYKLQNRDIPAQDEENEVPVDAAKLTELLDDIIADLGPRPASTEEPVAPAPVPEPAFEPVATPVSEQEWQSEPEREWTPADESEEVPYVSELMPDATAMDDISLDALLDEIIAAGDI